MQPIEWLIKGMIPKRGLSIIYGESGTFKSFFALDQALRVGLNHNVIYVAAEGENGYRQRIEAWFKHFGKCKPKLHFVMGSIDLFQDDELYIFSKEAERRDPRMMVIDTMSMNIGGADTNNGRDMVKVFQSCKRLAKHLNCAIVLVHHTNAEGRRATGSQRIKDSSDTMIRLSRVDDSIAVECKKTKDSSPFKTIYLKEVPVMLGYNDQYGNPRTSLVLMPSAKGIRESTLTELQEKVLSYLVDTPEASQRQLADDIEEKFPSVQSAMKALRKKGYLNREGKEWRVTKEGMQSLGEGEPSEPHELTEPSEVTISSNGNGVHSEHSPHLLDSEHPETQEAMPGFEPLSKEAVEYPM
jgi:predicted transcriptional regulator